MWFSWNLFMIDRSVSDNLQPNIVSQAQELQMEYQYPWNLCYQDTPNFLLQYPKTYFIKSNKFQHTEQENNLELEGKDLYVEM